jgi:hypothetical protein
VTETAADSPTPLSAILGPNGKPAVVDPRPVGLRCDLCGRRPQLPATTNPRSIKGIQGPVAQDMVGGRFHLLATCDECFSSVVGVLRSAIGVLRAEDDLVSFVAIVLAAGEQSTERPS